MVKVKKRTQHLKNIAQLSVQSRKEKKNASKDNDLGRENVI